MQTEKTIWVSYIKPALLQQWWSGQSLEQALPCISLVSHESQFGVVVLFYFSNLYDPLPANRLWAEHKNKSKNILKFMYFGMNFGMYFGMKQFGNSLKTK